MTTEYYLRLASGREVHAPDGGGFYWIARNPFSVGSHGATDSFSLASRCLCDGECAAVAVTTRFGALDTALETIPIARVESVVRVDEAGERAPARFLCLTSTCHVRLVDVTTDGAQLSHPSCPSCRRQLELDK